MNWTKTLSAALLFAGAGLFAAQTNADSHTDVPVEVGGAGDYDACGTYAEIYKLKADGDGFLAVRSGPGTHHREIGRLYNKDKVFICETRGKWHAIVYDTSGEQLDCGVSTPIIQRQTYSGPCKSGWVHSSFVKLLAG